MYLHDDLVSSAFSELSSRDYKGKRPLERTSALFYFLAFDATLKKCREETVDLNPRSEQGERNRDWMEFEFERLVQLHPTLTGKSRQVTTLGEIRIGGEPPSRRLSSNFLTVPVKKASQSLEKHVYPRRPAPLISLGKALTGLDWGAAHHQDWRENLALMLSDFKSSSPFTDLSIFVLRDTAFTEDENDLKIRLANSLSLRFSEKLSHFWASRISAERIFFKSEPPYFSESVPHVGLEEDAASTDNLSPIKILKSCGQRALIQRISYLERLLNQHRVNFDQFE